MPPTFVVVTTCLIVWIGTGTVVGYGLGVVGCAAVAKAYDYLDSRTRKPK